MKFRVSDGARFFLLGQRKTIFVEASQQILEVDDLTAYLTCLLAESMSQRRLEADLVARGAGRAEARRSVRDYLLYMSGEGLLEIAFDAEEGEPLHTHVLDLQGAAVSIAYHDRGLLDLILPVFDHQASEGLKPSASYAVAKVGNRVCVSRSRSPGMIVAVNEAVPAVKALLTEDVLASLGTKVALHAALLVKNGKGLLICGAPGAGKSTLALALLEAGFACGGDDIALMRPDGLLRGVPFAPALKRGSWGLLEGMRGTIEAAPVHRRLDNQYVRYLASVPFASDDAVPLGTIVLLRRRKGRTALAAVEPARVLSELFLGAFTPTRRLDLSQFDALLGAIRGASAVELSYMRLDEAVVMLSRHHDGS
ncbi:serine kinase [Sinorhizobium meliloti]|uniref:serine kinase n=1 Tax=Rhizobium meliloti TaxID=382 RepID=UPI000B498DC5|nr:serine kinase [Sinorhizobium meliloti]ASP68149.1 serine kinase [Sinorhizobium meliloti]MQX03177.1 serine kinase [Sinorhizobium meliloti]MQX05396.1 serine kinase [Sinorhizobium meliloti]RVK54966.1 serine kinase [Sinorhizobium meliloti]